MPSNNQKRGARQVTKQARVRRSTPPPRLRTASGSDSVTINQPQDGDTVAPAFSVSGAGSPDGALVTGILTDNAGNTFQSCPPTAVIQLGAWTLNFQDVPANTYILAVHEVDPNDGADSVNITVNGNTQTAVLTVTPAPTNDGTGNATVSGTCQPSAVLLAAVVSASKPTHPGSHRKVLASGGTFSFSFANLPKNKPLTATVYPLNGRGKAKQSASFKCT